MRTAGRSAPPRSSSPPSMREKLSQDEVREIVRPHVVNTLPDGLDVPRGGVLRQPDRALRHRRPRRRHRPHRPQDHRRHLWRRRAAWRRRLLRQGPDQGRPLGRLCRRYLAKNVVAAGLADRCTIQLSYAIGVSKPLSVYVDTHGTGRVDEEKLSTALQKLVDLSPARHPRASPAQPADLCAHRGLWPFRPRARSRWRLLLGEAGSRRPAAAGPSRPIALRRWLERPTRAQRLQLYGRRRGRRLRAGQQELLERAAAEAPDRAARTGRAGSTLRLCFAHAPARSGSRSASAAGEHLAWQAARHPEIGFIGAELFLNGVAGLLGHLARAGIGNVRIHPDDARPLLKALADRSIGRAFLLFPDPWPKARHARRRFVSPETLAALARILKPGAELRIASDDPRLCRLGAGAPDRAPDVRMACAGARGLARRGPTTGRPPAMRRRRSRRGASRPICRFRRGGRRANKDDSGLGRACGGRRNHYIPAASNKAGD